VIRLSVKVFLKNYFTTEIVTMDFLLVQFDFTIRHKFLINKTDSCSNRNRFYGGMDANHKKQRAAESDEGV